MKTMLELRFKQVLCYGLLMMGTGILTGIGFQASMQILTLRQGTVGGEILFLPLIVLLYISGFWSGRFFLQSKKKQWIQIGIRRGQSMGIPMGMQLIEQLQKEYGGEEHGKRNDHFKKAV